MAFICIMIGALIIFSLIGIIVLFINWILEEDKYLLIGFIVCTVFFITTSIIGWNLFPKVDFDSICVIGKEIEE